jgi:hypothetical protein
VARALARRLAHHRGEPEGVVGEDGRRRVSSPTCSPSGRARRGRGGEIVCGARALARQLAHHRDEPDGVVGEDGRRRVSSPTCSPSGRARWGRGGGGGACAEGLIIAVIGGGRGETLATNAACIQGRLRSFSTVRRVLIPCFSTSDARAEQLRPGSAKRLLIIRARWKTQQRIAILLSNY